jgi:hypothetical protein
LLHRILLMFILSTVAINDVDDNTWSRFRQEYVLTDPIGNPGWTQSENSSKRKIRIEQYQKRNGITLICLTLSYSFMSPRPGFPMGSVNTYSCRKRDQVLSSTSLMATVDRMNINKIPNFHFVFIRSFYWCLYVSYNINYNNRINKNYRVMVAYFPDTCYTSRCGHVFVTLNDLGGQKKKNTID